MASSSPVNIVQPIMLSLLFLLPAAACAASFSCTRVTAPDEKAICADRQLSEKDVRMATTYSLLRQLLLMGGRGALQDEQTAWLQKRKQCGASTICLAHLYDTRLDMLNSQYRQMASSLNR